MFPLANIPSNVCVLEYEGTNYPIEKGEGVLDDNVARGKGSYVYWVKVGNVWKM